MYMDFPHKRHLVRVHRVSEITLIEKVRCVSACLQFKLVAWEAWK